MQDGQNYYSEFFTAFLGAAITWLTRWFFDRHKEQKDVQQSEVELSERVAKLWRETSQDLEAKVKDLRAEMDTILTEMDTVKSENKRLKSENASLKSQQDKLQKRISELEKHGE